MAEESKSGIYCTGRPIFDAVVNIAMARQDVKLDSKSLEELRKNLESLFFQENDDTKLPRK